MTETKPKRRWFNFSIRDLLWLTALVALGVGWWLDHRKLIELEQRYAVLEQSTTAIEVAKTMTMLHEAEAANNHYKRLLGIPP
jgi:hypothetical protein